MLPRRLQANLHNKPPHRLSMRALLISCVLFVCGFLFACDEAPSAAAAKSASTPAPSAPLNIVTSIRPLALLAQELWPQAIAVSLLQGSDDPHHFQLSPSSIKVISGADLVLWQGEQEEPWLKSVLHKTKRPAFALAPHSVHQHNDTAAKSHLWLSRGAIDDLAHRLEEAGYIKAEQRLALEQGLMLKQNKMLLPAFVLDHDALGVWMQENGIRQAFALSPAASTALSAKRVLQADAWLDEQDAACLMTFSHSAPSAAALELAMRHQLKVASMDILAMAGYANYSAWYQALYQQFLSCFR